MRLGSARVALFCCALCAWPAEAEDLAGMVVAATKLQEQLVSSRDKCIASERSGDIEGIARANPAMFQGIDESSPHWSRAREAYLEYAISTCVPSNLDRYQEIVRSAYQRAFTDEELKVILDFYRSDLGKKFASFSRGISAELTKQMYVESAELREDGARRFQERIEQIARNGG